VGFQLFEIGYLFVHLKSVWAQWSVSDDKVSDPNLLARRTAARVPPLATQTFIHHIQPFIIQP